MTVRIGIAGLGRIGGLHARNLAASGLVSSLVVHDADDDRARRIGADLDADVAPTFGKLLGSGIDGVVISTPTPSHEDLVHEALRSEIPVFCEKPFASSVEAGVALATMVEDRGVPLQVGLQRRCDPQLLELRERLRGEVDGRLLGLRVVSSSWRPPSPEYLETSEGFFRDKLLHDVDVVRWLTGLPIVAVAVAASGTATGWVGETGDVDTVSASILLAGDVVAQIWSARLSPTRFEFRVDAVCAHREMSAGRWDEGDASGIARKESPFETFVCRFEEAYKAEVDAFCHLAGCSGENVCPPSDAMASEIATASLELSWREGRVVRMVEAATS